MVGQRPSGQLNSWPRVWSPRAFLLILLSVAFGPPWPLVGISKYTGNTKGGGGSDLPEIPWYFLPLVYSDEGFE